MNKRMYFICFLTIQSAFLPLYAQFYTISADTAHYVDMNKSGESGMIKEEKPSVDEAADKEELFFSSTRGIEVEIEIEKDIPVFVSVKDSLMAGLLEDRLSVCLPLDFLKMNSNYGYRTDPIFRCTRFHDGIDLRCSYSSVYSMMPGTVKEVHFGNRGYGNYVVLEHGNLECLYGHLSRIFVTEGEVISAGTVVAISGNTGKSTGPHLHIRMKKDGKSVNPKPFIDYLNDYITRLQDKIRYLRFGEKPQTELNIANLAGVIEKYGISHPRIVIAQALLETGYFTSRVCLECNNLFGLRRKDGSYYEFNSWEESVKAYKDYVQYKYKGGSYLNFLRVIGYAEDPNYVFKVAQIAKSL